MWCKTNCKGNSIIFRFLFWINFGFSKHVRTGKKSKHSWTTSSLNTSPVTSSSRRSILWRSCLTSSSSGLWPGRQIRHSKISPRWRICSSVPPALRERWGEGGGEGRSEKKEIKIFSICKIKLFSEFSLQLIIFIDGKAQRIWKNKSEIREWKKGIISWKENTSKPEL